MSGIIVFSSRPLPSVCGKQPIALAMAELIGGSHEASSANYLIPCNPFLALETSFGDDRCPFGVPPPMPHYLTMPLRSLSYLQFLGSFYSIDFAYNPSNGPYFSCSSLYSLPALPPFLHLLHLPLPSSSPFDPSILAPHLQIHLSIRLPCLGWSIISPSPLFYTYLYMNLYGW